MMENIREAEEKDKGIDKGDMKDNNVMHPMSGHFGSQVIVQGLLIYLHFSLPFYRTQILVAHLLEYKEDGDLGLHKNKSIVKQQAHTNRLAYGIFLMVRREMLGLNVASSLTLSLKLSGHVFPSLIAYMLHHKGGLLRMSTLYSQGS
ncbi:hypothetical protein Taro_015065 [Colocasia esculenta]|uniref:Uncharacterized protein n=1 Tax=Colocasia esculenta TaxID=4460 RepID=A0A843US35_COLES|nr:hypothetical protein [Colocasia esculenta]